MAFFIDAAKTKRSVDSMDSKTFCARPFLQYASFNDSSFRLCCSAHQPSARISTKNIPILETFNSNYVKEARRDMCEGRKRPECSPCYELESLGVRSDRQNANAELSERFAETIARSMRNGFQVDAPIQLDLRAGNLCNLRCQSCYPDLSSGVSSERRSMALHAGSAFVSPTKPDRLPAGFTLEQISEALPQVQILKILGGEPMLATEIHKLFDDIISRGLNRQMELHFHTNLTLFDEDFLAKVAKFKSVNLCLSLDGVGEMNSYLRYPSSWPTIQRNIENYARLFKDSSHIRLSFSPVIQISNICHLPELLNFILGLRTHYPRGFGLNSIVLTDPDYYRPNIAPDFLKALARQRMAAFIEGRTHAERELLAPLLADFSAALGGSVNPSLLKKYVSITREYDRERKCDIAAVFPEFTQIRDYLELYIDSRC